MATTKAAATPRGASHPALSTTLRATVARADASDPVGPPDLARALRALGSRPPGRERLWAAAALLFGVPGSRGAGGIERDPARAESLLLEAVASEEAVAECPDCAALWAFARYHGAFAAAPRSSLVVALAEAHGLSEASAALVLAARAGSSLGRLSWGELRSEGVVAQEHLGREAAAGKRCPREPARGLAEMPLPPGSETTKSAPKGCLEAMQAAMAVASEAMENEGTAVPQPVDLEHRTKTRWEDRQHYALAMQLAEDGYAEGLAAKAEMLFYGRDQVVPAGWWQVRPRCGATVTLLLTLATLGAALRKRLLPGCRAPPPCSKHAARRLFHSSGCS